MLNKEPNTTNLVTKSAYIGSTQATFCTTSVYFKRQSHCVYVKRLYSKIATNRNVALTPANLITESKHNPPANKEWSDSVYAYDKNFERTLPQKDIMAKKIIQQYFHLSNCKYLARSRRMRSLLRKKGYTGISVAKPEIKQTSDKAIFTIYTFDKQRQNFLRKIYFNLVKGEKAEKVDKKNIMLYNSYDNWRRKFSLKTSLGRLKNKMFLLNKSSFVNRQQKIKYLTLVNMNKHRVNGKHAGLKKRKYDVTSLDRFSFRLARVNLFKIYPEEDEFTKKMKWKRMKWSKRKKQSKRKKWWKKEIIKRNIPYTGLKLKNQTRFFRYITRLNEENIELRKDVYYAYLKRILFMFKIKVLNVNNKIILYKRAKPLGKPEIYSIDCTQDNIPQIDRVNLLLSNFLNKILNKYNLSSSKILSHFIKFSALYFKKLLPSDDHIALDSDYSDLSEVELENLKKEALLMNHYINFSVNRLKFNKYLPALKLLLGKVYNKTAELNIVNLKYPHLNASIYTKLIANMLQKKIGSLRVVKRALGLVKSPLKFVEKDKGYNLNNINSFNGYASLQLNKIQGHIISNANSTKLSIMNNPMERSLPLKRIGCLLQNKTADIQLNTTDNLQLVLKRIYPRSLVNGPKAVTNGLNGSTDNNPQLAALSLQRKMSTKVINVLNSIRYKWVTGVKIQIAGRLTRRYKAARALYKHKYKGSLKDTDYARKSEFMYTSMPVIKLRNSVKANSQYSSTKSKKRIGAFGVKGWISST